LLTLPYAAGTLDVHCESMGFYPLVLLLLMGVNGAFMAGDFFNLYVFFEVLLMASFVLMTLGGTPGQINGGIRYVILNLMASITFLSAAGVTYGTLGTLNMAQMAQRLSDAPDSVRLLLAGLMLVAFGGKAGLFPLFFWLPASYHTPHPAVTALFGGVLTKVGVYVLFRLFPLLFPGLLVAWQPLILTIAGLTMSIGVLGAFAQPTIRRLLSFHIISQVGYMIMALGIALDPTAYGAGFALATGIFFMVHNMVVKSALMMGGGIAELEMGSGNLGSIGGLAQRRPLLALLFFVAAFSLAGIPPSSGFVGKLGLLQASLDVRQYWIAGVSLGVSLLTTMSMIRLWQYTFWGKFSAGKALWTPLRKPGATWMAVTPMAILVAVSLALGLFFAPALQVAETAARHAIDREGYIDAVAPYPQVPDTPSLWSAPALPGADQIGEGQ
jgi:multicomponent Na+:H+ antiporter subunit D